MWSLPATSSTLFWALLPPIIAIALALITKEVYSSLFIGIVVGGLLYSNFSFEGTVLHVFNDGIVAVAVRQLQRGHPDLPGDSGRHGVPDEQGRRLRRLRPLGQGAHQEPGGRPAGHHRPGRA